MSRPPGIVGLGLGDTTRRPTCPYPHVCVLLNQLRQKFRLAIVIDAQSAYAHGELHKVGLTHYFDTILVSGDLRCALQV
jgi:putative hydrolase of the HAD superfamily